MDVIAKKDGVVRLVKHQIVVTVTIMVTVKSPTFVFVKETGKVKIVITNVPAEITAAVMSLALVTV